MCASQMQSVSVPSLQIVSILMEQSSTLEMHAAVVGSSFARMVHSGSACTVVKSTTLQSTTLCKHTDGLKPNEKELPCMCGKDLFPELAKKSLHIAMQMLYCAHQLLFHIAPIEMVRGKIMQIVSVEF